MLVGSPIDPKLTASVGRIIQRLGSYRALTALRSASGTKRLLRIAVTAPTIGQTYSIRARAPGQAWVVVAHEATTTTPADLIDAFVTALNADPQGAGFGVASRNGSTDFDLESLWAGADNPIELEIVADPTSDLGTPTVVTAGALSFEAKYGTFYEVDDYVDQANVVRPVIGELDVAAGPVVTYTITHDGSGAYVAALSVDDPTGVRPTANSATWAGGADADATDDNAVAALAAKYPEATVANPSTGSVTVSFPVGYKAVETQTTASGGSAALSASIAANTGAVPDSVLCCDDGSGGSGIQGIGEADTGYRGDEAAFVLQRGAFASVAKPSGATITHDGIVWVETAAGSDKGLPFTSPSPSRFPHPVFKWVIDDTNSGARAIIGG